MESESACGACFVSAQPESNDQTEMRTINSRTNTVPISTFVIRKSNCSLESLIPAATTLENRFVSIARQLRNG